MIYLIIFIERVDYKMGKNILGNIEPKCEYCKHGSMSADGKNILCPKKGVLTPDFFCKKFCYDPIKRKPRKGPELPEFSPEDFSI